MLSTLARAAFLAFLVWVPIPLGSNRPIFWAINAAICLLILTALLLGGSRRDIPSSSSRLLAGLTIPSVILLLWMLVQAMPWTPSWLHNPVWDLAPEGEDWAGSISVNPSATLAAALRFVTLAIVGLVAARIAMTEARAKQILVAVLLSSTIVAGWGLLTLGLGWEQAPLAANSQADGLTSFFVNRNNAAVFIGLGLVVSVALLADRAGSRRGDDDRWGFAIASLPERAGPYLLLILLLGVALISTASRAGVAAALAGMAVAFAMSWRGRPRRTLLVVVVALVVMGMGLLFLGTSSGRLFERLGDLDFATQDRWRYYADTLRAIAAEPLSGHGAGTFADFFPLYRSTTGEEGILLHAHNTYLEVAAELGLPFALLGLVVLVTIVVRCIGSGRIRPASSPASVAAVAATVVVAIHSAFEFSLQVQAIAICLAALLGAGVSLSAARSQSRDA